MERIDLRRCCLGERLDAVAALAQVEDGLGIAAAAEDYVAEAVALGEVLLEVSALGQTRHTDIGTTLLALDSALLRIVLKVSDHKLVVTLSTQTSHAGASATDGRGQVVRITECMNAVVIG